MGTDRWVNLAWIWLPGLLAAAVTFGQAEPPVPAGPPTPDAPTPEAQESERPEPATLPQVPERRAQPVPGDEVVLIMRDGQRISGIFVAQTPELVAIRVGGVEARVPASDVERVVAKMPLHERYRQMRAMIDDGDAERLLLVAEWLRTNGLLDEAAAELDFVLKLEPSNGEAARLRDLVEKQRALRDRQRELSGLPPRTARPAQRAPSSIDEDRRDELWEPPTLTSEQINLVRVYEVDLADSPRLVIPRETVERLLTRYASNPLIPTSREGRAQFHRLPPEEILSVMFRVQARDLYGEVQVLANPPSVRQFKDNVNRGWLATSCASTACHGGPDAGALQLVGRRPSSDASVYSNFLTIERHRLPSGEPLLNFDDPERSPLLQMGLPRQDALFPHPDVKGWTPAFRNARAKRFQQTAEWIRSLYQPRPEHPIAFPPAGPEGAPAGPQERIVR